MDSCITKLLPDDRPAACYFNGWIRCEASVPGAKGDAINTKIRRSKMNKEFNKLADDILEFCWKDRPVMATMLGVHKYDDKLDKTDLESRKRHLKKTKEYLKRLDKFSPALRTAKSGLSKDQAMDWKILKNSLQVEIAEELNLRRFKRNALVYPQTALRGCYVLVMRDFAPLSRRMKSLLRRLKQIPRFMKQGQKNLSGGRDIPKTWTQIAIHTSAGGGEFFKRIIPQFAAKVPRLKKELLAANDKAIKAFAEYEEFLKSRLLARSKGDFAVGRRFFDFLLKKQHQLPYTSGDLLKIGNRMIKQTQKEMRSVAKRIDPKKNYARILEDLNKKHPAKDGLLDFYKKEVKRARNFVRKKDLLTIQKGEALSVIETPVFNRRNVPFAAYMAPDPFQKRKRGFFWVTPVDEKLSPEKQEEQLQGHSIYGAVVIAVHECYPGHHVQLTDGRKVKSKVRRWFGTPLFAEGWALYCEQMMYEQGFFKKPERRLFQLRNQLIRACRVVIDVGLQTRRMSFKQAVEMLVKVAKLDPIRAAGEVRFYCHMPTYPMSYTLGKLEILKLREDYKKAKGRAFDLKEFHDNLLSYGSIPVQLIRERMLERS
jgi:uncharacterized protein (DUF885 family)